MRLTGRTFGKFCSQTMTMWFSADKIVILRYLTYTASKALAISRKSALVSRFSSEFLLTLSIRRATRAWSHAGGNYCPRRTTWNKFARNVIGQLDNGPRPWTEYHSNPKPCQSWWPEARVVHRLKLDLKGLMVDPSFQGEVRCDLQLPPHPVFEAYFILNTSHRQFCFNK